MKPNVPTKQEKSNILTPFSFSQAAHRQTSTGVLMAEKMKRMTPGEEKGANSFFPACEVLNIFGLSRPGKPYMREGEGFLSAANASLL